MILKLVSNICQVLAQLYPIVGAFSPIKKDIVAFDRIKKAKYN